MANILNLKEEALEMLQRGDTLSEIREKMLATGYFFNYKDYDNKMGRYLRRQLKLHPEFRSTAASTAASKTKPSNNAKASQSIDVEYNGGEVSGMIKAPVGTYQSEEDILKAMDLSPELFTITSCRKSKWDAQAAGGEIVQMESFRVSCKTKDSFLTEEEKIQAVQESISRAKKMIEYPLYKKYKSRNNEKIAVFQVCDCHFGAYCSKKQHGIDWGPEECEEDIEFITARAIECLRNDPVDSLIIAMTGDALNSDTITHTTAHGTQQFDGVLHHSELVRRYFYMMTNVIDRFSQSLQIPINILHTVGNHDTKTVYDLIFMLKIRYDNDPNVIILDELNTRKYREFGNSLLMFTHGQDEGNRIMKAPLNEAPEAVGRTKITYIISEHYHQYKLNSDGRTVQITGSTIAPPGTWTKNSAFVGGRRGGQLLVFDEEHGLTSQHFLPVYHDQIDEFVVNCKNFI